MSDWIETELKLGIPGESAWEWVRSRLGPGRIVHQENHFFDLPDRAFRKREIGIRLRLEGEARTLAVKGAPADRDELGPRAVTRRLELESPLDPREFSRAREEGFSLSHCILGWRRISPPATEARRELMAFLDTLEALAGGRCVERYAGFTNRRETLSFECVDPDGPLRVELELDRTEFPGGRRDYEIEVEKTSERDGAMTRTHRALVEWLETQGGIRPFTVDSKLARLNAILDGETE